jgi:hypothetical protein
MRATSYYQVSAVLHYLYVGLCFLRYRVFTARHAGVPDSEH